MVKICKEVPTRKKKRDQDDKDVDDKEQAGS